jgi:membrane protein implicated in regulation of membrane protease activity
MPAAAINAITRGHLLLAAAVFGLTCIVAWFGEADGLRMLSMAVPDAAAWVTTFEISAYLDVIAALVATSAVTRIRAIRSRRRLVRKPRARSVGLPRPTKAANDDEDGAFALAG